MTASQVAAVPYLSAHAKVEGLDPAPAIAGCLIFAVVLFLPPILNDGDTFWQISTGAWIVDHRAIPASDPFSFTAGGRPWFAHEWLSETLMALAFRTAGMQGILILAAAATGLTAAVLLHHLRRYLPAIYAFAALAVALSAAAPSMLARPHLIAWPCLALWCGGLLTARANRTAPSFALLLIMVLWVNLHGSFMLGLLLPGTFMIDALLDPGICRRRIFTSWAGFILAAWSVALINPDFLAGALFPIRVVGMQSLAWIGEWKPTDFTSLQPIEIIILGGLALGLAGKLTLPPIRLLMFLALIHGALSHARHGQLLAIVGTLILAEPFGASLGRGGAEAPGLAWRWCSVGAVLIAVTALVVRVSLPLAPERTGVTLATTLEAVPPLLRARPVLNEYGLGGQLIFNGVRPFIDGRTDLYGDTFVYRYHRAVSPDRSELERTLSDYRIEWTIFPSTHPIVAMMDGLPGWRRLVDAEGTVIHVRADELPQ
ncbi:MAG TPA: hypothetical protein VHT74_04385 [Acetobacteraceae bacterium]|nr:hypothetical protein [Acetobacteraceae bacterium]